jgi:hypothetical protein
MEAPMTSQEAPAMAQPSPPLPQPPAPRLTHAQIDAAISAELKRLVGGRTDEVAKQELRDIYAEVWGQGVDNAVKVFGLPLTSKRNGLARLQAMKLEPSNIPTATISQDVTTAQPDALDEISADGEDLPPETPTIGSDGYVLAREVDALKLYAEVHGQKHIFDHELQMCSGFPDAPQVSQSVYLRAWYAIERAIPRTETDVP